MSRTSETAAILKAQEAGYRAYLDGLHVRECPHGMDTAEEELLGHAWLRGYAASRTDRARENRKASPAG
ncbi:ribosome modulation factor [Nesterenkonia sp. CF4.4]|uniref:ribosome modulation factor n=1 Tax=Nesterenkonia sp. CF4.4 TaxID=3373079 RepID=UPI003EE46D5D